MALATKHTRTPRAKPVRFAVIGLGHIAQVAVVPAFAHAEPRARLQAIVSGDAEKLREVGDRYDVPSRGGYDDLERLLAECDAAYIATPNSEHVTHAVRAARAGVHVLCEKPLAATTDDARAMIGACREAGVLLMTAYRLHFDPLAIEALSRVRAGDIGDVKYFASSFSMSVKPGNIRTRPDLGGGTLYDLGVYCINAARTTLGGEPTQVFAHAAPGDRAGLPGIDEMTSAVLVFDNGRHATFTTSFAAADVSSFRVVGTDGDLVMQPAYEYVDPLEYTLTSGGRPLHRKGRRRDQFAAEILYFADCIRQGRAPEPSGEEGARDVRIVEALYESAQRGEPIALPSDGHEPGPDEGQARDEPPVAKPPLVNVEPPHD
ncbi:MAG TPA: Gfo/Idh/MocA family oxidoreductase [Vicinamibacterales bacterium]|nr:Gfo/Idh/MocA family oxidoreductase [Vicinamibacterales bacterium]